MIDGLYQSVICFYMAYLVFAPATFSTESGRDINDYKRIGVFIATAAVIVVNTYILLNTYRWDWFMVLITTISVLLIWLWTGAYTSFTDGFTFYGAAAQCYGSLTFWCTLLLTIIICLLPRFSSKAIQKIYFPRDIDIVREQIRQGRFAYLKDMDPNDVASGTVSPQQGKALDSASSSDISKPMDAHKISSNPINHGRDDDTRPIYPPSIAPTATTRGGNTHSQNGSDGTEYMYHGRDRSVERVLPVLTNVSSRYSNDGGPQSPTVATNPFDTPIVGRSSLDRPRPSFERFRSSMEGARPRASFEQANDFTSAAYLTKVESTASGSGAARQDLTSSHMRDL